MSLSQQAPAHVSALAPYQPGKPVSEIARQFGLNEADIVKLASNENPLGMSPKARAAMLEAAGDLGRYPDPNGFELKATLAARHDVPPEWITLGNGSNDILELVAHAFLVAGTSSVFAQYSFAVYALATQATGAKAIVVPAVDYGHDLSAMRAAIDPSTRVVFIANPNNPTGTFLTGQQIADFVASVPSDVVVVLDEAYNEYLNEDQLYDAMALVRRHPNLLVSRSFSKAYGLAGLRVGYGVAQPALTDLLNRIRQPFNVNTLAQAAAAASLGDAAFLKQTFDTNLAGMAQLESGLKALGLSWVPSCANFLLVEVGDKAAALNTELLRRGVIVRPVGNYGLQRHLRVSIGTGHENAVFLKVLPEAMRAAGC